MNGKHAKTLFTHAGKHSPGLTPLSECDESMGLRRQKHGVNSSICMTLQPYLNELIIQQETS